MGVCCAINGCLSSATEKIRKFYRFPLDEARCRKWIRLSGRQDLKHKDLRTLHNSYRICDLHFLSGDHFKKRLKSSAIPILNLPQPENQDTVSKYTQTDVEFEYNPCQNVMIMNTPSTSNSIVFGTPSFLGLSCNVKIEPYEENLQKSDDDEPELSPVVEKIMKIQKLFKRNYRDNRYNREYKMFAMNIYFTNPLAYRILAKTLYLPSVRALRRTNIDIGTSFSENVIRCLKSKVNKLSESERICVLCADKMSLKRHLYYQINRDKIIGFQEINGIQRKVPASYAFVVMARGLFSKWTQPLAYCFLSHCKNYSDFNNWLDNIIMKAMDIGLNVVAFTTDQGSYCTSMAKVKNVTAANPFFYVNGKKIYYIFDVPQLLKSLRDNLINYDFTYRHTDGKDERASWEDVEKLYEIEKERSYQIAFKLTKSHIRPNRTEKMEIKFAAQVFSSSVATAMQCSVGLKELPQKSLGTAKFIQLINDMFDILNSSSSNVSNNYKKEKSQQEYQMKVLQNTLQFLKDVRIVQKSNGEDVTNSIKCLRNLEITIESVMNMSTDLRTHNFKYLLTRRLNQDELKKFFGAIRQEAGSCQLPRPYQFAVAFRKCFLTNIISYFTARPQSKNCAKDLEKLLDTVENCSYIMPDKSQESESGDLETLIVGTVDYRFELPEDNALSCVSNFLLKKCKQIHKNCTSMDQYVKLSWQINATKVLNMREFCTGPSGLLIKPQELFKDYVRQMDEIATTIFNREDKLPRHVGNEILKNIDKIVLTNTPCECFPTEYLKKLFVRFRIFNITTHNNRNFRNKSIRKKVFSISSL